MLDGKTSITRSLGEEPRRLIPEGIDRAGTVVDPRMKPYGGVIRLPVPIVTYVGREKLFGRDEPKGYDYEAAPNKYRSRKVLVPCIDSFHIVSDRPVLNMSLFRADNVIRVSNRVRAGDAEPVDLQTSVNRYHDEIERYLCGKDGLLTRDVFGVRCRNSLRCVMVPEPSLAYWQVGLPAVASREAHIEDGDWVIASRSPVLWQGSVLAMKAVLADGCVGQANPYIMQGLGLDMDGDQMAFIRVPTEFNPQTWTELKDAMRDPVVDTFKWANEFLVNNRETEPAWRQIGIDLESRLIQTGLSVGPEDCLDPASSEFLSTVKMGAKDLPDDLADYAAGLGITKWAKQAQAAAMQICKLKLEVGLLGAATDKMNQVLLAFGTREQLRLGLELKEKLTDLMMKDAKRGGGTGYSTAEITALLDQRGQFEEAVPETAMKYLASIGFSENYLLVVELLYDLGGTSQAVRKHMSLLQACRARDRAALVQVLDGNWGHGSIAARIHEYEEGARGEDPGLIPYSGILLAGGASETTGRPLRTRV